MNNIFLIGMMASGKTSVGKILAQKIGYEFFDSDQEIEKRCGATVATIFSLEGESGFRKRECDIIEHLTQKKNIVLATGGGSILNLHNRILLKNRGTVFYLTTDIDTLMYRTTQDKTRPLLVCNTQQEQKQILVNLYQHRHPLYTEIADYIFDTSNFGVNNLVKQILLSINQTYI